MYMYIYISICRCVCVYVYMCMREYIIDIKKVYHRIFLYIDGVYIFMYVQCTYIVHTLYIQYC